MIRFGRQADMPEIMEIWEEGFGDAREEIAEFFRRLAGSVRILLYEEEEGLEDRILGQLCLLPVKIRYHEKAIKAEYIYAVTTKKAARGRGVCSGLLEAAAGRLRDEGSCAVLVPADDGLASFYEKRGFRSTCFHEEILQITAFSQETECAEAAYIAAQSVLTPVTAAAYIEYRHIAFAKAVCIEQPDAMAHYAVSSFMREGGICARLDYGKKNCGVLCRIENRQGENTLFVQEITIADKEEAVRAVKVLLGLLGCACAALRRSYGVCGLYLPTDMEEGGFFNLVLD